MRIFVLDERAQGIEIADKISNYNAPLLRFSPGDTERYVSSGNWIGGSDDYCGVAAQKWCDLPSGVFPCYWTSAGDSRFQGDPS